MIRSSNLLTALLKDIAINSSKKSINVRETSWSVCTHAKPRFLRYVYFRLDCFAVIFFQDL